MSLVQEDTRPLEPLPPQRPARKRSAPAPRDDRGCLYQGLAALAVAALALLIVALAAWAGWSLGQGDAGQVIARTQEARVRDQLARIAVDVEAGNQRLLAARLAYLAEVAPVVEAAATALPRLRMTATALSQPRATSTPVVVAMPVATATVVPPQTVAWQPAELLDEARVAIGLGEYRQGVDLLQALEALAPDYARETVRELILSTLTKLARQLYRSDDRLAEAILVTDEAIRYGLPGNSGLRYERHVAALYLEARSQIVRGPAAAVPALRAVLDLAPDYRNGEVRRLLGEQHGAWAELLLAQGDACGAQAQWQQALAQGVDSAPAERRDEAARQCGQEVAPPPVEPAAPVEQAAPAEQVEEQAAPVEQDVEQAAPDAEATLPVGAYITAPGS